LAPAYFAETAANSLPIKRERRGYSTWEQVAGYFDGDGCPKVHVGVYAITVTVTWSDQYREMLQRINQFLSQKGVVGKMGRFRRGQSVYYELHVSEGRNALRVLKEMLPHLDKKWSQVNAAINYLENRITGNQFIEVLNEAIRTHQRSSSIKVVNLPYTKRQGKHIGKSKGGRKGRVMTQNQIIDAKVKRNLRGLTFRELAEIYDVAPSTIHRSLTLYV
jgi:hypothetical protein